MDDVTTLIIDRNRVAREEAWDRGFRAGFRFALAVGICVVIAFGILAKLIG